MARLLMSNKDSGVYDFVFEPLVKGNVVKAVEKYLVKYGYVRRILLHPCDSRLRKLSLILLDKEKRNEYRNECCNGMRLEHKEFMADKEAIVKLVTEMLEKLLKEYEECAKKYSDKLL